MELTGIDIDYGQCDLLADTIDEFNLSTSILSPISVNLENLPQSLREDFLFILTGICHDTKSLSGIIQGHKKRGWDYLLQKMFDHAVLHPEDFTEKALALWTTEKLQKLLSDRSSSQDSTITDPLGRVHLIQDIGNQLGKIGGHIRALYDASQGFVNGKTGFYSQFQRFKAYQDPLLKKSTVFLKFASQELGWEINDSKNLVMPIDYHNQRIALRYGLIVLPPDINRQLRRMEPINNRIHNEIRQACQQAYHHVVNGSRHSLFPIDSFLWNLGRYCCPFDSEPHCQRCMSTNCILNSITNRQESSPCALTNSCKGSINTHFRDLKECNIKTEFY